MTFIISCPNKFPEEVSMFFGFNFDFIFFEIFSAKEIALFGILSECFLGIIKTCPLEIGFISKVATVSLFSSIL